MWAQLSTFRVREGKVDDLTTAIEQLRTIEQPDSGLLRTMALQDQNDATRMFMLVIFESEEKARARESDPRRQEGLQALRANLADVLDGPPEFTDLIVIAESVA